jgi:hypothetical protein
VVYFRLLSLYSTEDDIWLLAVGDLGQDSFADLLKYYLEPGSQAFR